MADNAILAAVYNQYLTTYAPQKTNSRYDTHKRSELRNVYNSMVRVNRDAPLYKFDTSNESREYVIGLKEEARSLHNNFISIIGDSENAKLDNKIAYSTDESILSAEYVGRDAESVDPEKTYDIEVKSLATPQVNLGLFLPKNDRLITPGQYAFDLTVGGQGYEFQYNINDDETNYDIQNKLARLINNSGIKLSATVEDGDNNTAALRIESSSEQNNGDVGGRFEISDSTDRRVSGSVAYLGIDYVSRESTPAEMSINGQPLTSDSNTFIIDKQFEVKLNNISPEEGITATVGIKPDADAAIENISNLVGSYNGFIKAMSSYSASSVGRSNSLLGEMNGIYRAYHQEMEKLGITIGETGELDINAEQLANSINDSPQTDSLSVLKKFTSSVLRKSNQISVNPVAYMNKTVVAYKNPGKNFNSPYTSSAYSGLMFNSYC